MGRKIQWEKSISWKKEFLGRKNYSEERIT